MAQTPLRPRDLTRMDGDVITDIQENKVIPGPVPEDPDDTRESHGTAEEWIIPLDSIKHTGDEGTLGVPMSRIAMRDTNGKIPESMLPSYIDEIMFGTFADSSDTTTFTVQELTSDERVYQSPTPTGTAVLPPTNAIFHDTTSNVQYRWVASEKETYNPSSDVFHGFVPIPNSKTIITTYGIDLSRSSTETTIDAKMPDYFSMYTTSGATEIGTSAKAFSIDGSTGNSVLTAAVTNNQVVVSNLTPNARYMVNLQLEATPKTLSPNIINVSFTCYTLSDQVQQMDMSGPTTSSVTYLNYTCALRMDSSTSIYLTLKADEAINVKTRRFTIFELV